LLYQINRMMQLEIGEGDAAIDRYLPGIYEKLEGLSKEEIVKRFVWREFNRFSEYYANAPMVEDLSVERPKRGDVNRGQKGVKSGLSRSFVNLGHMDGLKPQNMLGIISDCVGKQAEVGRIEIYKTCSFVEVQKEFEEEIIAGLNQTVWSDRKVRSESATAGEEGKKRGKSRDEKRSREEKPRGRRSRREDEEIFYSKADWKSLFETDDDPKKTKKTAKKRK
ncbi:MAG: DbpA RNA binding domain-containing protein, partial [Bacteroidales bacterium]|nr:DbpA RNA binding domain-containing protein [Bacteroidales bacterium]